MNKKAIFTIIAIVALIGSIVLGVFTDIGNDLPAIGISALSLGALIILTYKKSDKKDGITIASIICMVIAVLRLLLQKCQKIHSQNLQLLLLPLFLW